MSAAINNAAMHFRPGLWFSGDRPECYDPVIIQDPGIMKFAPQWFMDHELCGQAYKLYPHTYFYVPDAGRPVSDMFENRRHLPWFRNTLMAALHTLYVMGFRTIILCGCDFEPEAGKLYAHDTKLTEQETEANLRLYSHQVETLISLKTVAVERGLRILDASAKSKMQGVYPVITFDEAMAMFAEGLKPPGDIADLPHGTRFVDDTLRKALGVFSPPPRDAA
jgi:hypothetical protein